MSPSTLPRSRCPPQRKAFNFRIFYYWWISKYYNNYALTFRVATICVELNHYRCNGILFTFFWIVSSRRLFIFEFVFVNSKFENWNHDCCSLSKLAIARGFLDYWISSVFGRFYDVLGKRSGPICNREAGYVCHRERIERYRLSLLQLIVIPPITEEPKPLSWFQFSMIVEWWWWTLRTHDWTKKNHSLKNCQTLYNYRVSILFVVNCNSWTLITFF